MNKEGFGGPFFNLFGGLTRRVAVPVAVCLI